MLLSVADHHARTVPRGSNKRVIGILLGQDTGKTINVANSFGIPFEEDEKDSVDCSGKDMEPDSGFWMRSETEREGDEDEQVSDVDNDRSEISGYSIGCSGCNDNHCIDDMYA